MPTRRNTEAQGLLELGSSDEKYRIMVDSVKDYAIFMLDADGRVATWNLGAERIKGYRAEHIIGQPFSTFYPEADVLDGKPERQLRLARELGRVEDEGWRIRGDGSRFLAHVVITAVRGPDGRLEGFVKVLRDITEHHQIKQEKEALLARLERIIAGTRDGLFEGVGVAHEARLWVSARFWEILGHRARDMPETVAESILLGMVHTDDLPRLLKVIGDRSVSVELRMRTAQGEWLWVHLRSTADLDSHGNKVAFWGSLQDISERKRDEKRLARHEALLASTSRIAGVGGWEYDVETRTLLGSDVVFDICGVPAVEDPALERALQLCAPEARQEVAAAFSTAVSNGIAFDLIVPILTGTARRRWIRLVGEPQLKDGKTVCIEGAFQDVTDMRDAAEALRQARDAAESASRAKSEFLATMSHEIRTPLNGVIGMTDLLLETALNADQRDLAMIARSSGQSLLALINNILDFSKIESGSLELENIDFDLRNLIDETVDVIALQASEKRLEVLVDVDLKCPQYVRGDPNRLRQILLNLLSNAVKFTDVGDITLTVSQLPSSEGRLALQVSVQDSGIGIPEERIGKLFTAFTQADASTTRRYGGTGLGLAICRRLIAAMGGTIGVESQPGMGTTFRFEILLDASSNAVAGLQAPIAWPARVLLVSGHPVNLRILSAQLQGWGITVETANDSENALLRWDAMAAGGETPQLVILDGRLADDDSKWLGHQIRRRDNAGVCKLVLLNSMALHSRSIDLGPFDRTLAKPVKRDALLNMLAEFAGEQPARMPAVVIESTRFDGMRALLVDDNSVNQKLGVRLLERMGFHVTPAWNGRQALELLRARRFDVVLMDCQMPEMDGYDATRTLRHRDSGVLDREIPVIAMTANALSGDREGCLAAGMTDYLTKPINRVQLAAVLRNVIKRSLTADAQPVLFHGQDKGTDGDGDFAS